MNFLRNVQMLGNLRKFNMLIFLNNLCTLRNSLRKQLLSAVKFTFILKWNSCSTWFTGRIFNNSFMLLKENVKLDLLNGFGYGKTYFTNIFLSMYILTKGAKADEIQI